MLKSEAVSYRLSIGEVGNLASEARDRDQEVAPTAKPGSRPGSRSYRRPGSRPGSRSYSEARAGIATSYSKTSYEKSKLQEN